MKSDSIIVSNKGLRMESALNEVEKIGNYKNLSPKQILHLRLLTEEMMGLMRSITGETEGEFWIEDEDGVYEIHLRVDTRLTSGKREQLLSASTSGKNESARGFMGRLRDFFDRGMDEDLSAFTSPLLVDSMYDGTLSSSMDYEWSMMKYVEAVKSGVEQKDETAFEAWDELEKSVVRHVADDVRVSIRGREVEMIIIKKLA